ncbi:MmgE/PrpD family protein [Streptomyces niger]|uniref:MmgE/PrpD family protein n=1 Tax=Streptomyces niger TaxID=66373 RepID=UPI000DA62A99|nr:MmgE/PrpD family protein [Streptomyces niger]
MAEKSSAPEGAPAAGRTPLFEELGGWAARLTPDAVPARVLRRAASQVLSQLGAVRAGMAEPLGRRLTAAFGPPQQSDPRQAASVLAGLGSFLNLDDTAYAGHLSNSTVAVPLAFAHALELDGPALLTAVVAANECAARITAAATLGPLRGQTALHAHLAGAVAGRLHCERAPAARWTAALGLAYAQPPWPLLRAFLASDARILNAFGPVRTAMDACDAAAAGLTGAPDLLEHPDGFLRRFATVPLPEAVTAGLGTRWHTETFSYKLHPGGPGIDAAVDCALDLHRDLGAPYAAGLAATLDDVLVEASLYTVLAVQRARRYLDGPERPLGALVLDIGHPVATALLTGRLTVADLGPRAADDPVRRAVAAKVRLRHDPDLTRELLASEAPFGEALRRAGPAAEPWLREFGGDDLVRLAGEQASPADDFAEATKATGARVTLRLKDGRTAVRELLIPYGAAGPHTRAHHAELVSAKFRALGGPADVADALDRLPEMAAAELRAWLAAALRPAADQAAVSDPSGARATVTAHSHRAPDGHRLRASRPVRRTGPADDIEERRP